MIDHECHHAVAGTWSKIAEAWPPAAKVLGVTATPERLDGVGLRDAFDTMVLGPDVRELIDGGYLASFRYLAPSVGIDLSQVRSIGGDYNAADLEDALDQDGITGNVVEHYQQHLAGRTAIGFCVTVAHAEHVALRFRDAGIPAASIDGTMSSDQRHDLVNQLRTGELRVLTSCEIISEGFLDAPAVGGAILLRPTPEFRALSPAGRAMFASGKAMARRLVQILDHVGNVLRHGLPDAPHVWSLDSKEANPGRSPEGGCRMPRLPSLQRGLRDRCRARQLCPARRPGLPVSSTHPARARGRAARVHRRQLATLGPRDRHQTRDRLALVSADAARGHRSDAAAADRRSARLQAWLDPSRHAGSARQTTKPPRGDDIMTAPMTDAELDQCRRDGALLRSMVSRKVELEREGKDWKGRCPFHAEKTPSFHVYEDGHYHCFGCNEHGTVFDFIMQTERVDFPAAKERVAVERGISPSKPHARKANGKGTAHDDTWQPIVPPPADASKPSEHQLQCDTLHEYRDADDRLLCYVRRFEAKGDRRKLYLPITYGVLNGKRGWHDRAPATPRPLYGLNRLSHAAPDATAILVEGEKAADAAQRLFPHHVALTWMGGAAADGSAVLSPLEGRNVILWPDADAPGRDVMARIAKRLTRIRLIDTANLPDGYDAANLEGDGCDDPDAWLTARLRDPEPSSHPASAKTDDWPEPVDFMAAQLGAPILKEHHVPPSLWPFISDNAERMGVATSSVALCAIVSAAAAINEEWKIQPKRNDWDWTEGARLWGALVGPPSVLKSPVIALTTKPIEMLDIKAMEEWNAQQSEHAAWKEAVDETIPEPKTPPRDRFLVESATIEALQEVLRDDAGGKLRAPLGKVLVRQDELEEFLANMDKYSTNGKGNDRGAWLRAYNGGRHSIDRIGRGSFATKSWSCCLIGGIQPDVIREIAQRTTDNGLIQRFMLDVPGPQAPGLDRAPNRAARDLYHALFPALTALHPGRNADGYIKHVTLHTDAHATREDLEALARIMQEMPDVSSRLASTFGKWPGLFARLCLTFHLVEAAASRVRDPGGLHPPLHVVTAETANRVRRYMRAVLAPSLLRAETLMFGTVQTEHAAWIASHILAHRLERVTAREIVRAYRSLRPPEERGTLSSTMEALCLFGWLAPVPPRHEGATPNAWRVNPDVHVRFAERAEAERKRLEAVKAEIAEKFAGLGDDDGC